MRVHVLLSTVAVGALLFAPEPTARSSNPAPALMTAPKPGAEAIKHVVVLMNENRSTDHYFAHLHDIQPDFEAQPAGAWNPDPLDSSHRIAPFHQTRYCEEADLDHSAGGSADAFDDGKLDGFTTANQIPDDPSGARVMGYYTQDDLLFYYALYSTFATNDRYFSSLMGPTFPNRFFAYAATSWGMTTNQLPTYDDDFAGRSIFNTLDEHDVSWKVYYTTGPFATYLSYVRDHGDRRVVPISEYYDDAANGHLPQVSFIEPGFGSSPENASDEHPPSNMQVGQLATNMIINALFASPTWPSTAMFLTYDEDGGFYDHVPPPPAPVPDESEPEEWNAHFDRYGFRVPMVAISPFARRHFVSHSVQDHTSILKFIETRFGLPPLTARDAAADNMFGLFDFSHASFATPPRLPAAIIDPERAAQCE